MAIITKIFPSPIPSLQKTSTQSPPWAKPLNQQPLTPSPALTPSLGSRESTSPLAGTNGKLPSALPLMFGVKTTQPSALALTQGTPLPSSNLQGQNKIDPQLLLAAHTHFQGLPRPANLFFSLVLLFLAACGSPASANTPTATHTPAAITVTASPPPSLTPIPATETPIPPTATATPSPTVAPATQTPTPTQQVISQLYFQVSPEGRQYMSERSYGAPPSQSIPTISQAIMNDPIAYSNAMRNELNIRVDSAVAHGMVTQAYGNEVKAYFDDPVVIDRLPDPFIRFTMVLGDLVLPNHLGMQALLGQNGYRGLRGYYLDDPELARRVPTILQDVGAMMTERRTVLVHNRTNGDRYLIFNPRLRGGTEIPERLAGTLPHEALVHETNGYSGNEPPLSTTLFRNTASEEIVGNLIDLVAVLQLSEIAPGGQASVFQQPTYMSGVDNPLLLMWANSGRGNTVGIAGDGSGRNVLPGNLTNTHINSFVDAILLSYREEFQDQGGNAANNISAGSQNLVPVLQWLLGPNVPIPASLDKTGDGIPDYGPELIAFIDQNLQHSPVITPDDFLRLARIMGWEIQP